MSRQLDNQKRSIATSLTFKSPSYGLIEITSLITQSIKPKCSIVEQMERSYETKIDTESDVRHLNSFKYQISILTDQSAFDLETLRSIPELWRRPKHAYRWGNDDKQSEIAFFEQFKSVLTEISVCDISFGLSSADAWSCLATLLEKLKQIFKWKERVEFE